MAAVSKDSGAKSEDGASVKIVKDGPYMVCGGLPLAKDVIVADDDGSSVGWKSKDEFPRRETYALCRCGHSKSPPFCDGMHAKSGFNGTETADRGKFADRAEIIKGQDLVLSDDRSLCALARFCHNRTGNVWGLTEKSGDPSCKEEAIRQACNCPAGRLVESDKRTGKAFEPELEPSIGLVEDPEKHVSGPIFLKGGVPLEASDGTLYEKRNRVTLCRCGASRNKPFCDGGHIEAGFDDGDDSLD